MFKFTELKRVHLEITNNCQAACPMCNRNWHGGLENPLIKNQNWSLDDFKSIISQEVLNQISGLYFCGNFGDPMLNNDLIEMCKHTDNIAPSIKVDIHTNAGARLPSWWESLAHALPVNHMVFFGIDGLEDTHHLYRVNTQFNTVLNNARAFINAGGNAEWVFIKFKHNEHQVETARQMSQELGFKNFTVKNSSRFIIDSKVKVLNRNGEHLYYIEQPSDSTLKIVDKHTIDTFVDIAGAATIACKVLNDKEVYIDAYKNLYPCSWLGSMPYSYLEPDETQELRLKMYNQHQEIANRLGSTNTQDRSVRHIIESNEYQTVWQEYWSAFKLLTCARVCGTVKKFSQPKDQVT